MNVAQRARAGRGGVGDGISVGRSNLFDRVEAGFGAVSPVSGVVLTSQTGISASNTVCTGESTTHEKLGVKGEDA